MRVKPNHDEMQVESIGSESGESESEPAKKPGADHKNCHHEAGLCVVPKPTKKKKGDKKLVFLSQRVYEKAKEHGSSNGTKVSPLTSDCKGDTGREPETQDEL